MQRPEREIERVVKALCSPQSPESQKAALEKYYSVDAAFRHPLATVPSGPNSRNAILGIYQWYNIMSPNTTIEVRSVTYNSSEHELFLDVTQDFHLRWSPLTVTPARLIVHLILAPSIDDPKRFVISTQEDFYHPEDVAALIMPPLIPIVRILLKAGSFASNLNAFVFGQLAGYWAIKPQADVKGASNPTNSNTSASPS